jgi:hypothetical protein
MTAKRLPYQVKEALITVCGKSFWLKDPLFNIFREAGVPEDLVLKYEEESKFKFARLVLGDLEGIGEEGWLIQKRLLTILCNLRNLVDDQVPDRDAGLEALRHLKNVALKENLIRKKVSSDAKLRQSEYEKTVETREARTRKLAELNRTFADLILSEDPHSRGYSLEDLLNELFSLFEIEFHKAYRTVTGQVDGHFHFEGFDYLVEARWRKNQPTVAEIGGFKTKVDKVIQSTRGLFVAVQGIRPEVIQEFSGEGAKIIFMDGSDLSYVLEGRISLRDALRIKIEKATQAGLVFLPLYPPPDNVG